MKNTFDNLLNEILTSFSGNTPLKATTPGLYKSGNTTSARNQSIAQQITQLEQQISSLTAQKQKLEAEYKKQISNTPVTPQPSTPQSI